MKKNENENSKIEPSEAQKKLRKMPKGSGLLKKTTNSIWSRQTKIDKMMKELLK